MTTAPLVPVLPESAPFTPEQRAYLNGFLAGLFSHTPSGGGALPSEATPRRTLPLTILFASQTGNAEKLAKQISRSAASKGFTPKVQDVAGCAPPTLPMEKHVLIVASTFGDGEPPDSAKGFWESLAADVMPRLEGLRFSVCALGDTNYPKFCQFGKDLDARLEALGAERVHPRQDCDVDYEEGFDQWLSAALQSLGKGIGAPGGLPEADASRKSGASPAGQGQSTAFEYSKKNPFPARLLVNRKLNKPGSAKDVRHFEIGLEGSGLVYEAGDALGVVPTNDASLVDELLAVLKCDGEEAVKGRTGEFVPLRLALQAHYEITRIPQSLLQAVAARSGDEVLSRLLAPDAATALAAFTYGREIIDLLLSHPGVRFQAEEFVAMLRKLQPRLYSISSSPKAHPDKVHLTVSAVRYESHGRKRGGVCSTFLAERVGHETPVPVFVHANKAFRPPPDDRPLIMVGPGTGIAPFKAFLEERRARGAQGRNWLFFGDQKSSTDYLYQEEIEAFQKQGVLHRLDLAWSRDQAAKVYVQDRMLEHAAEIWRWLQDGAAFCVCGDASRMAKDVDEALQTIVKVQGAMTAEKTSDYLKSLKAGKRYCRDVY